MYLCFYPYLPFVTLSFFFLLHIKKERENEQGKERRKELVPFFKTGTVKDLFPFIFFTRGTRT